MQETQRLSVGIIGISGRGSFMLETLLQISYIDVPAICDLYEDRVRKGVELVQQKRGVTPDGYQDYRRLLARDDLSAVLICTTWITHSRIAIAAMRAGKNAAIEVGGAASVEECWQLVRTSEETGKFCMLLENICYGKDELTLFRMARQGLFGEIVHVQGGYEHDLRDEICLGRENRHGRLFNFMNRNGELYPTHQLGPLAKLLRINRGNRFLTLSCMTSKSRGLHEWILENKGAGYDLANTAFTQGDVTTTMIRCAHGETILLVHDCCLPRPYSRNGRIQGTQGIWMEDGNRIYLQHSCTREHEWDDFPPIRDRYLHPLWQEYEREGVDEAGHGGVDLLVLRAFAESARDGLAPPIDVYDTAAWMSITCLSEQSAAMGGMPVAIPDFTNGMWIDREPFRRGKYCLEEVCMESFEEIAEETR